jgi:hypothetical protein
MEKKFVNGKVAVVIAKQINNKGQGWFTTHKKEELVFDSRLVSIIENGYSSKITKDYIFKIYGIRLPKYYDLLSIRKHLKVVYIPKNEKFRFVVKDGREEIILLRYDEILLA